MQQCRQRSSVQRLHVRRRKGFGGRDKDFFFEKTSRSTATSYKEKERASSYNL
jgi:hypothetical protein